MALKKVKRPVTSGEKAQLAKELEEKKTEVVETEVTAEEVATDESTAKVVAEETAPEETVVKKPAAKKAPAKKTPTKKAPVKKEEPAEDKAAEPAPLVIEEEDAEEEEAPKKAPAKKAPAKKAAPKKEEAKKEEPKKSSTGKELKKIELKKLNDESDADDEGEGARATKKKVLNLTKKKLEDEHGVTLSLESINLIVSAFEEVLTEVTNTQSYKWMNGMIQVQRRNGQVFKSPKVDYHSYKAPRTVKTFTQDTDQVDKFQGDYDQETKTFTATGKWNYETKEFEPADVVIIVGQEDEGK
jgi:hypothetical protein